MTNPIQTAGRATDRLPQIQYPVKEQLDAVIRELQDAVASNFPMIEEFNSYLLGVPGKLFRPTLVLLASQATGGEDDENTLTFAAVVELVHLATLVHDDAVDHSVLRRGMPTVNSLWTHQIAIIMGDYLYSRALTELARTGNLEAVQIMASVTNEMSVGEMRQLLSYDDISYSEAEYYRLIGAKTASLMSGACEIGALSSGDPTRRAAFKRYGWCLGMAFQIADDILDYVGSEDVTGKAPGMDLRGRKVTLPLVGALREMSPAEVEKVRHTFTLTEPGDVEVQETIELVRRNGGLDYARQKAVEYADLAETELADLTPGAALDALRDSVVYAVDRAR